MTQFNLTKKAVGDGRIRITTDGQHVANGHWACRRDLLKQAALLTTIESIQALYPRATVDELPPDLMDQVIPHFQEPITYERTIWMRTNAMGDVVLFTAKNGSQVWIRREYADLFCLESVTSECADGDVTLTPVMVGERDEWQVVVMPLHLPYQEGLS